MIANFDYQIPAPIHASGFRSSVWKGWSLSGIVIMQSGLPMTVFVLGIPVAWRGDLAAIALLSRQQLCRLAHVW